MVVEDEGITAMSLQSSLEDLGYSVTSTVLSGEEAIIQAGKDRPDLVLMDISLRGEMDGIEAAGQISNQFNIPIVYLTAQSDEHVMTRIKATRPSGYIAKPFHENEIRCALEIAFDKYSQEKQNKQNEAQIKEHRENLLDIVNEQTTKLMQANNKLNHEIKSRITVEAELMRSAQLAALGELAAGLVHEINNPINGIINYAQILSIQTAEGSDEHDIAGRIIDESTRITNIIKDLLSYVQGSRKEKSPVYIDKALSHALSLTRPQLTIDSTKLILDVPADLPPVMGQSHQLTQVFLNIINNASYALNQKHKGAHKDKLLSIKAAEASVDNHMYIRTSFHDSGTGIPVSNLNNIIKPFFTTKPASIGTGIGLSISNGIIKDMGGKITVYSIENQYTDVIIDLPIINNTLDM